MIIIRFAVLFILIGMIITCSEIILDAIKAFINLFTNKPFNESYVSVKIKNNGKIFIGFGLIIGAVGIVYGYLF